MPRLPIDYSKSVIYKIHSNDQDVNKIYIGSTTNFRKRKHKHKCLSLNKNNQNTNEYNYYIYQYINNNNGWNNFNMTILERYNCNNKIELRTREAYYINKYNPELNKSVPLRTNKKWKKDTNYYDKKIICVCGIILGLTNKARHYKSNHHVSYLQNPFYKLTL